MLLVCSSIRYRCIDYTVHSFIHSFIDLDIVTFFTSCILLLFFSLSSLQRMLTLLLGTRACTAR